MRSFFLFLVCKLLLTQIERRLMNTIDANITLGELVNEKPACMSLLERLRLR